MPLAELVELEDWVPVEVIGVSVFETVVETLAVNVGVSHGQSAQPAEIFIHVS